MLKSRFISEPVCLVVDNESRNPPIDEQATKSHDERLDTNAGNKPAVIEKTE